MKEKRSYQKPTVERLGLLRLLTHSYTYLPGQ